MIKQVLDNIQITVRRVHLRIEDWWIDIGDQKVVSSYSLGEAYGGSGYYAVGITLSHLHLRTTEGANQLRDREGQLHLMVGLRNDHTSPSP